MKALAKRRYELARRLAHITYSMGFRVSDFKAFHHYDDLAKKYEVLWWQSS